MDVDKCMLRKSLESEGVENIMLYSNKIIELIDSNPFRDKIYFLLNNPELAKRKVKNLYGELSAPNCIGTALFTAGVSRLDYPYYGHDDELNEHMQPHKDEEPRNFFFHLRGNPKLKVFGAFIFSISMPDEDWHAGIYLGNVGGNDIAFSQHGHGGKFGIETVLNNYSSPSYYLPKTLSLKK